jgi:hypothetical protein
MLLILLINSSIDSFVLEFNPHWYLGEIFKVFAFSIAVLIGLRILVTFFRKKKLQSVRIKMKFSILVTIILSSYFYIDYTSRLINNKILNQKLRVELIQKVSTLDMGAYQMISAKNLTITEYNQLKQAKGYPNINNKATNIRFSNSYYSNLAGDYDLTISYLLPVEIEIESYKHQDGKVDYKEQQTIEKLGEIQKVTYEESKW